LTPEEAQAVAVVHLYTGEDGESHVEDLEVPITKLAGGALSEVLPLNGAYLRTTTVDGPKPFHNVRERHFCVPLVGGFELRCADGTTRRIVPGTVLLAEDVSGHGHASVEIDPPRLTLFLPLPDDFDTSSWKRLP
jgi:hypothetical protein